MGNQTPVLDSFSQFVKVMEVEEAKISKHNNRATHSVPFLQLFVLQTGLYIALEGIVLLVFADKVPFFKK